MAEKDDGDCASNCLLICQLAFAALLLVGCFIKIKDKLDELTDRVQKLEQRLEAVHAGK